MHLFYIDPLSIVMIILVGFVTLCIASFSWRYLDGDKRKGYFYVYLIAMVLAVFTMVIADQLWLLLAAWGLSQWFLTCLMRHKYQWLAAKYAAQQAFIYFVLAWFLLVVGVAIFYNCTGTLSIQAIVHSSSIQSDAMCWGSVLILIAIMIQSSLWPFHRWLLSSLNSPTPVSAIMHAGLVNGGGFLCARFAPVLLQQEILLSYLFAAGIMSAVLGTLWKLMQADIKRMLACSTLGQMGFMLAQCGLGLFPAAVAHLCWHGLFKAYLFLSSGSAVQEQRLDVRYPPSLAAFLAAISCGFLGATAFAAASHKDFFIGDTTSFLVLISWISGAQFSLPIIRQKKYLLGILFTALMGSLYGVSVYLMEWLLLPLGILQPQAMTLLHWSALFLLFGSWLAMLFIRRPHQGWPSWVLKSYVAMLNAAQPAPKTVTVHRNHYHY